MAIDTQRAITSLNVLTAKFDFSALNAARQSFYPRVCTVVNSRGASEDYAWLGSMPGMREWLGERLWKQLHAARYEIVNKLYESSIAIEKSDIEDDRLGILEPAFAGLGIEATKHPDELLFSLIAAGGSSLCFDGQFFFDTDHAWGDSGAQSNALTLDASDHTNVTASEWQKSFENALIAMMGYKNDQGKLFHRPTIGRPSDLLAVVPLQQWKAAKMALEAVNFAATTNVNIGMPELVVSPYLAATKWQLYHTGGPVKPYIFQARRPLQRQMKGLEDREFKDVKFMCDARYNVGYGAWWEAVETTFN